MSSYLKQAIKATKKHHPNASPFKLLAIIAENCEDLAPEATRLIAIAASL